MHRSLQGADKLVRAGQLFLIYQKKAGYRNEKLECVYMIATRLGCVESWTDTAAAFTLALTGPRDIAATGC